MDRPLAELLGRVRIVFLQPTKAQHHFFSHGAKPIGRFFLGSNGVMSSRIASNTALNRMSYLFSIVVTKLDASEILHRQSLFDFRLVFQQDVEHNRF